MTATVTAAAPRRLLRALNLYGLDHLDPILLAALADERPVLLIAPHGTAKSELLNRLAAALGLAHRHYNASLIAFDDLLGYPVPVGGEAWSGQDFRKVDRLRVSGAAARRGRRR